ncbi:hypothetical protein, partial [Desulfosporosinus fructosivorans]
SFLWGGQDSRQIGHPWPLPAGNILVSRPADERGLKPSLATTNAKASERVSAAPLGWGRRRGTGDGLFPALLEKRETERRVAWGRLRVAWGRFVCHVRRLRRVRVTPPRPCVRRAKLGL